MANPDCTQCNRGPSPVPAGTVGAFEGAHYFHCGCYRPEYECLMRDLGFGFCAVCRRVIGQTMLPFLDPVPWLYALYADLLGRAPEAAGLAYWTDQRNSGRGAEAVANGFLASTEYCTAIVTGLYQQLLSRAPDDGGLAWWVKLLQDGRPLQEIILGFCNSLEYRDNNPPPERFVESLYNRLLGRPSEAAGKQYWVDRLTTHTTADVINGFLTSREYCSNSATRLYRTLLGREPEEAGLRFWTDAMSAGTPFQRIQLGFLASTEYQLRAQERFP
jgi:hypothetical protein